jgi:hypothetical protein
LALEFTLNHVLVIVDVPIRNGAGKEAGLRRMGHLTMEERNGPEKTEKIVVSATIWRCQASKLV